MPSEGNRSEMTFGNVRVVERKDRTLVLAVRASKDGAWTEAEVDEMTLFFLGLKAKPLSDAHEFYQIHFTHGQLEAEQREREARMSQLMHNERVRREAKGE